MNTCNHSREDIGFQIAPMVDLILVLLIYFMATVAVRQVENVLGFKIPTGLPSLPKTLVEVRIHISEDGRVSVGETSYGDLEDSSLKGLRKFLQDQIRDFDASIPVTIVPNGATSHKRVVEVLDACVGAGIAHVVFDQER